MNLQRWMLAGSVLLFFPPLWGRIALCENVPLSTDDLVALVKDGRQQYRSIVAEYVARGFTLDANGRQKETPAVVTSYLWRWMADGREYVEMKRTRNDGSPTRQMTFAFSQQWFKQMDLITPDGRPNGIVTADPSIKQMVLEDPVSGTWEGVGHWLEHISRDCATVSEGGRKGTYVVKGTVGIGGPQVKITVDSQKGFLPIEYEAYGKDGKLKYQCKNEDLRLMRKDMWLPYRTVITFPGNSVAVVEISKAEVNIPIPKEQLDFVFPKGTLVDDRIKGIKYQVEPEEPAKGGKP